MDKLTEQRAPRRGATITRRAGLTLGMAAALAGAGVVAAASPALAGPPVCGQERAYVYQTNSGGTWNGPSIDSLYNPGEFNISQTAEDVRYVFAAGVHRPRRTIKFTFRNQDDAVVKSYETTASDNGGVVRQESNVFKYDFTTVGSRVRVYAEIRTRCGGDDVPRTVYVGAINTTP
ncbi:hypothetical protein [Phytohabitans houttuyneae]|uniref:Uncharacterized protein n=1 Tax=Phytohabitans houttuyneae TaxID=1076126 RepID=A0A6V8KHE5_9ACTN|nr:hypothetical protein [Phytohabitans houttuyneae]GFJ83274.1 hypothetical protein Phou_074540 [Phytohabitans houttuyneae]